MVEETADGGATSTDLGTEVQVSDESQSITATNTFDTSLDTDGNGGGLPQTGAQVAGSILTALVLLAGGYVLMAVGRRRKAEQH